MNTCRIGTARINYRGTEKQLVLNTTIKSGAGLGKLFAPTWDMVMDSKQERITWQTYAEQYTALLRQRYALHRHEFIGAMEYEEVILCCYCADTSTTTQHCHRYLLADILEKVAQAHGIQVVRLGEVVNSS